MQIKKIEFVTSAVGSANYPEHDLPEIALAGRSNVGKSSLINTLTNRRNIARISSKPGKTQTINFFKVNDRFFFGDVPGYGYAKVSKTLRSSWALMIRKYFETRTNLRAIIQIVDLRHEPSKEDKEMFAYLRDLGTPIILVATKADKISKSKTLKHIGVIKKALGISSDYTVIPFSSVTKIGKEELLSVIEDIVSG